MVNLLSGLGIGFLQTIAIEYAFIAVLLASFLNFITMLGLCIFSSGFTGKKRLAVGLNWLVIELAFAGLSALNGYNFGCFLITLSVSVLFVVITLLLPVKNLIKKEQLDLARSIIDGVDKDNFNQEENDLDFDFSIPREQTRPTVEKMRCRERCTNKENGLEIDFSHVKSVIERLEYYPLSTADKKKVRELEIAIEKYEKGLCGKEERDKVNEGLGALLKIMASYGV
jgi:hypothetical protein